MNKSLEYFKDLVFYLGYDHDLTGNDTEVGVKAFADFLYNVDLSDWDPRKIPLTQALINQKLSSLPPIHQWYLNPLPLF